MSKHDRTLVTYCCCSFMFSATFVCCRSLVTKQRSKQTQVTQFTNGHFFLYCNLLDKLMKNFHTNRHLTAGIATVAIEVYTGACWQSILVQNSPYLKWRRYWLISCFANQSTNRYHRHHVLHIHSLFEEDHGSITLVS